MRVKRFILALFLLGLITGIPGCGGETDYLYPSDVTKIENVVVSRYISSDSINISITDAEEIEKLFEKIPNIELEETTQTYHYELRGCDNLNGPVAKIPNEQEDQIAPTYMISFDVDGVRRELYGNHEEISPSIKKYKPVECSILDYLRGLALAEFKEDIENADTFTLKLGKETFDISSLFGLVEEISFADVDFLDKNEDCVEIDTLDRTIYVVDEKMYYDTIVGLVEVCLSGESLQSFIISDYIEDVIESITNNPIKFGHESMSFYLKDKTAIIAAINDNRNFQIWERDSITSSFFINTEYGKICFHGRNIYVPYDDYFILLGCNQDIYITDLMETVLDISLATQIKLIRYNNEFILNAEQLGTLKELYTFSEYESTPDHNAYCELEVSYGDDIDTIYFDGSYVYFTRRIGNQTFYYSICQNADFIDFIENICG